MNAESKSPEQAEKDSVTAIEELGGKVRRREGHVYQVHLYGPKVTDAGMVHLQGLPMLALLHLDETNVSSTGLVHLKGLKDLRYLNLSKTEVTAEGVKELQAALPRCQIRWK